ncbi:MAG: flagellar motor stator protein MotA [Bdellovibrionales bacterium]
MGGIVGIVIVIVCVFGGFILAGGHIHVVWQPYEIMIIFGAMFGAMVISNPPSILKAALSGVIHALTKGGPTKKDYLDLLQMLFRFYQIYRRDGPQAVEKHVEKPEESELFKGYPSFIKNHHAVEYLCDTMKIVLSADLSQYDVDDLLDSDIKSLHEEEHKAAHAIGNAADALPGLGIVAAVLGIVHTMSMLDQGTEVIGHSVGAALIGTFLGVFVCYGLVAPIAQKMGKDIEAGGQYLKVIKASLVALQRGSPPLVCIEFARRTIFPHDRPSFEEMDTASKEKKAA